MGAHWGGLMFGCFFKAWKAKVFFCSLFLLLIFFGSCAIADTSSNSLHYTLVWQNQPQIGESIMGGGPNYQYLMLDLYIYSDSDFAPNSNVTITGYGTMSASLENDSLISASIGYDGAIPYPPTEATVIGGSYSSIEVAPPHAAPININNALNIVAEPVSVTWASGGTHYPTLNFLYEGGDKITKTFTNAPIVVKSQEPNITVIIPTSQPTTEPPKFLVHIIPVGTDKNNVANTVLWCLSIPLLLTFASFILNLQYNERKYAKKYRIKWDAILGIAEGIILFILGDSLQYPPSGWQWISLQGGIIGLIVVLSLMVTLLRGDTLFLLFVSITKGNQTSKPQTNKKAKKTTGTESY